MPPLEDSTVPTPDDAASIQDEVPTAPTHECKLTASTGCEGEPVGICVVCREPFCEKHRSSIDPEACFICIDERSVEVAKDPLIDTDGVEHKGAVIHPIGYSYRTLMRRIVEMDDTQLEAHIVHVKKQVKDAEQVLDYRRIDLSASQVELEERGVAKAKKLRIRGMEMLASGAKVVSLNSGPAKTLEQKREKAAVSVADSLMKVAKMLGVTISTPEQLAQFAARVQAMRAGSAKGGTK